LDDVVVLVGGIIPDDDVEPLREMGVKGVFWPGHEHAWTSSTSFAAKRRAGWRDMATLRRN
jgi:methylmalonyl-CoA mutase cobalamin-binding domain/chain